jgi:hypothetical protein
MVAAQILDDACENTSKSSASGSDSSTNPSLDDVDHIFTQENILPAIQKVGDSLKPTDPDFWSREEKVLCHYMRNVFLKSVIYTASKMARNCYAFLTFGEQFHDEPMSGHRGVIQPAAAKPAMRRRVNWKNMREDIEKYIRACAPCSIYKKSQRAPQGKRAAMQSPRQVAESYNIDFLTDLPCATEQNFNMCMIVVDRFSQRLFCVPTWKHATGSMVAEQFHNEISCRHVRGVPRELISDRDLRFTASSSKTKRYGKRFSGD